MSPSIIQILELIDIIIANEFPVNILNKYIKTPSLAPNPAGIKNARNPANVEIAKEPEIYVILVK
jgi:hypothetical protein